MNLAVVTGANRGIGLELCKALKAIGAHVVAACRATSPELQELGVEVVENVDVGRDDGAAGLAQAIGDRTIHLLINCAGILEGTSLGNLNFDSMRAQFEVNSLGPLRVTAALRSNLAAGSKVALITSRMGSVADNSSGGQYGYRMSKSALNIAGKSLAIDLAPEGVVVALLHPGYVRTEMTGGNGLIDAEESAAGLLARIDELNSSNSGGFWHQNGEVLPW